MNIEPEIPPEEAIYTIFARFILPNGDSVTIGGNSVEHVFFETMKRFPERINCKSIGFAGNTREQAENFLKEFMSLAKRFG